MQELLEVVADLAVTLDAHERYRRLVTVARRLIPCDAVTLLRLDAGELVPLMADGLRGEALGRRFAPAHHPRLAAILAADHPVRFDDDRPDPFDGLFEGEDPPARVHACMGTRLVVDGTVVGVLTLDAVDPHRFDSVLDETVTFLGALAGAAVRTATLGQVFEHVVTDGARSMDPERELVGTSDAMKRVRHEIELLAGSGLSALVTGETGVGKELVAHSIHMLSARRDKAMVRVNCAALPEALAESELFGHVRGAFTGAIENRAGKFEIADGGTLFLDEIGELPLSIQPKLLRALQSGEVQRIGSDHLTRVDVRVIAATNRDLTADIAARTFRADLYYRLSVYPLHVPALRARREDIPLLSGRFLDRASEQLGVGDLRLSTAARKRLRAHAWPGNVRELEHMLLRGALRATDGRRASMTVIDVGDLGFDEVPPPPGIVKPRLRDAVDAFTSEVILAAVAECDNNWAAAARQLGLQRGNLHRLATRLSLRPE